jgi:hypothetical protein
MSNDPVYDAVVSRQAILVIYSVVKCIDAFDRHLVYAVCLSTIH